MTLTFDLKYARVPDTERKKRKYTMQLQFQSTSTKAERIVI